MPTQTIRSVEAVNSPTAGDLAELPPVFIILWDELESTAVVKDGLPDPELMPNFAALAQDSVWFPNGNTPAWDTNLAIMTFLTGTDPNSEGEFTAPTLFERLAGRYEMHLYEEKAVLARQFGCVHPSVTCRGELYIQSHFPLKAAKWSVSQYVNLLVPVGVLGFFGIIPSSYEPLLSNMIEGVSTSNSAGHLYYWHAILPHRPFVYNPDGTKHDGSGSIDERYLKQVRYVDNLLGRFVAMLKSEGLYDDSILVVTTDHGQQAECPCPVPLTIRAPQLTPQVSDFPYHHRDFLPTLFDLLGMSLSDQEGVTGISAFTPMPSPSFPGFSDVDRRPQP